MGNRGFGAVANMLPARGFDRFLHRHPVVHQVGDHLHVTLHLAVRARRAQRVGQAAAGRGTAVARSLPTEHHHRVHRVAHPLARLQAVHVVRVQVPVGHAVVQQDARIARHQRGTPAALDTLQLAHRVPVPVPHHEAGGVFLLASWATAPCAHSSRSPALSFRLVRPRISGAHLLGGPIQVNGCGTLPGILCGQHSGDGHVDVVGVGHVGLPVSESHLLRFHHEMDRRGGTEP